MANENQYGASPGLAVAAPQHRLDQQRDTKIGHGGKLQSPGVPEVAASVRKVAGDAAELVKEKARDVGAMAEEKGEALAAWIKERPITSVLIGAAVGYVLGKLARR